jgi:hypothetical protein
MLGKLIMVLGMHRSGTSAVAGMLVDYGVDFGPVNVKSNAFNPRGNRENRDLRWLHDSILERAGGSWWQPPEAVTITDDDRTQRDAVLATFDGEPVGVKDPRLLLVMDLWRDLDPRPIGVIRNPVAVRESLDRRSRQKYPDQKQARTKVRPTLPPEGWETLWCQYNRRLLAELDRAPFPVIDFDRAHELDAQVRAALASHRVEPTGSSESFEPSLAGAPAEDWRERAVLPESVELWDRLAERAVVSL